ncbi:MAG: hypothetical protein OJF47_003103 [Nitrospira sp.]|jgi:hypothetical protein|nr:MAG: hypothetical protein OJF47_003103 [Nitrospira sp.]
MSRRCGTVVCTLLMCSVRIGPHQGVLPVRSSHMDLIYLAIVAAFFLLSGLLISALDRL